MAEPHERLDLPALVRHRDYRRFLAIQLAPTERRAALYAVTAFAIEIGDIPGKVSQPLVGFTRLAWWREALQAMEQGALARPHPVLQALSTLSTVPYGALAAIITEAQHALEDSPVRHPPAGLDHAWQTLLGANTKPLDAVRYLQRQARIHPTHILRLLWMSISGR